MPSRDIVGVTRRADALEADARRVVHALAMLEDGELDVQRPNRILRGLGPFEFSGSRMSKRRYRQVSEMLFAERLRRRTRTAHQIIADRAARALLLRELEVAA